jgi:lysophospholipase L1-like esterase
MSPLQRFTLTLLPTVAIALCAGADPRTFGTTGPPLTYVVLGDSTAAGVGGDYEQGIAIATARELGSRYRVTMHNFAVSGERIRGVRERQLPAALPLRADLVLLAVTANDVTHLTRIAPMRSDLRRIVAQLRASNPEVRIVVTGSPDMGSPPRIPRFLRGLAARRTRAVNRMVLEEAAALNLTFAPIAEKTGPLFRADRTLFDTDRFHPNDRGYATWIPVLNEALTTALR